MRLPRFFRNKRLRSKPSRSNQRSLRKYARYMNGVVIVLLSLVAVYFFLRSDIFLLRQIEVQREGGGLVDTKVVETSLGSQLARSLFIIDTQAIADNLKKTYLSIQTVEVDKELPDKLIIHFREYEPMLVVVANQGRFLVAENGYVFAQIEEDSSLELPSVVWDESADFSDRLGEYLSEDKLRFVLEIARANWSTFGYELREIKQASGYYELNFDQLTTLISAEKPLEDQYARWRLIVREAQIQNQAITQIDLRFENPVVRYEP